jgi:protein TonB
MHMIQIGKIPQTFSLSIIFHGLIFIMAGLWAEKSLLQEETIAPKGVYLEMGDYSASSQLKSASTGLIKKTNPKVNTSTDGIALKKEKVINPPQQTVEQTVSTTSSSIGNSSIGTSNLGEVGDPNGAEATKLQRYLYELKLLIESHKRYPAQARVLGQEGKVIIKFVITKDGSVSDVTLEKPSHFQKLNDAALKLVEEIKKYKEIPTEFGKEKWVLTVPISYSLY